MGEKKTQTSNRIPRATYPVISPARPKSSNLAQSHNKKPQVRGMSGQLSEDQRPTGSLARYNPATTGRNSAYNTSGYWQGVVTKRIPLENETPDFDYARLFFSFILFIDLFAILGVFSLIILLVFLILAIIALALRATWLLGIMGFLIQFFFSFLTPLLNLFIRRENRQTVPVVNYKIRTANGKEFTARIKGQLRGTVPQEGDRFSLTGIVRHGILQVRGGKNLDNNEPILLPIRWSGLWLALIVIANLAGLIYYFSLQ